MKFFLILLLLFQFPQKPSNYVTDEDDILAEWQKTELNKKLKAFEESTSTQLFVYVANSLHGKNLEEYSKEIFNTWGIGQAGKDNGVLMAIFINDREQRIQVGLGLESTLPSSLISEIQEDYMNPEFREARYYKGIDAGIDQLIYYSSHKYEPKSANYDLWVTVGWIFGVSVVLVIINLVLLKKRNTSRKRGTKLTLFAVAFLLLPLLGPAAVEMFDLNFPQLFLYPPIVGAMALFMLTVVTSDKDGYKGDHEPDDHYQRRIYNRRDDSDSDDSFSGGGGGSSDSGGSSSKW